jgi:hypothetical protein
MNNTKIDVPEKKKKGGFKTGLYIVFAIAIAMGMGALYYNYRKDKEKTYVADPKIGDVYEMELKNGHFSTSKVVLVTKDSIYVTPNNYETNEAKGISEIDIERNYGIFKEAYSKKKLESLFAQDSIFAINRD